MCRNRSSNVVVGWPMLSKVPPCLCNTASRSVRSCGVIFTPLARSSSRTASSSSVLEDAVRLELRASGVKMTPQLRTDLEAVLHKHGGTLESIGHPTTTLEDLFLHIVEESKARPGRRYLPPSERDDR